MLAGVAQVVLPIGRPLYDGIVPNELYRYLAPLDGQLGSPTSYAGDVSVTGGQSPPITAATSEQPPQAQLIALAGAFAVPSGVTTLHVTITAVPPAARPSTGTISGNVYRIAVTDPAGTSVPITAGQPPTIVLRSPGAEVDPVLERLAGGAWQEVQGSQNAALSIFTTQVDALGDFAVVDRASGGFTATTLVVAATVGIVGAAIVVWAIRVGLRRREAARLAEERGYRIGRGANRPPPPQRPNRGPTGKRRSGRPPSRRR